MNTGAAETDTGAHGEETTAQIDLPAFALQMSWVMVPIGQQTHQLRGLNSTMVARPSTVEVSITL